MTKIELFFIEGTPIVADQKGFDDSPVVAALQSFPFEGVEVVVPDGQELTTSFETSLLRWEYLTVTYITGNTKLRIFRYYPDWCLEFRSDGQELIFSRQLHYVLEPLKDRFFSPPHIFQWDDAPPILKHRVLSLDGSAATFYRSFEDFLSNDNTLDYTPHTIIVQKDAEGTEALLRAMFVIEYDLRIMRRNVRMLKALYEEAEQCIHMLEDLVKRYLRLRSQPRTPSPIQFMSVALKSTLADLRLFQKGLRTYSSDTFTAGYDLRNYLMDFLPFSDTGELIEYYMQQAEELESSALICASPIEQALERCEFLQSRLQ